MIGTAGKLHIVSMIDRLETEFLKYSSSLVKYLKLVKWGSGTGLCKAP